MIISPGNDGIRTAFFPHEGHLMDFFQSFIGIFSLSITL